MDPIRVLAFLVAIALIVWYVRGRWQQAGAVSDAEREEMERWKAGFAAFKTQPAFQALKKGLDERYPTTFETPTDPQTYQIVFVVPMDEKGQFVPFEEVARAKALVAYLKNGEKKLQVSLDLQTSQLHETALGAMAFSAMVPPWAGK